MIALRSAMHRVSLNTMWLFASRVISQGLSAITVIVLARMLGAEGLGQYAFTTSIIFVANALTTYGTDTLIIREVARDIAAASRMASASLLIQLALSGLTILIIWLTFPPSDLRLYSFVLIPLSFSTVYSAILRGSERMDAYMQFVVAVAWAQLFFAIAFSRYLLLVLLGFIFAQIYGAVIVGLFAHNSVPELRIRWRIDPLTLRHILIAGLPLVMLMVLSLLYQRMGIFMLSLLADDASTGQFSAAIRIIEAGKLLPAASLGALFPVLARREGSAVWRIDGTDARLFAYAVIVAVGLHVLAGWIIPTLFGSDYLPAVPVLQLLGWSLIPYVIAASISLRLVAAHRERVVLIAMCIVVPISLALFAMLVAHYGLHGAAVAMLISESLQASILLILARRP